MKFLGFLVFFGLTYFVGHTVANAYANSWYDQFAFGWASMGISAFVFYRMSGARQVIVEKEKDPWV